MTFGSQYDLNDIFSHLIIDENSLPDGLKTSKIPQYLIMGSEVLSFKQEIVRIAINKIANKYKVS